MTPTQRFDADHRPPATGARAHLSPQRPVSATGKVGHLQGQS